MHASSLSPQNSTLTTSDGTALAIHQYGEGTTSERRLVVVGGALLTADMYRIFAAKLLSELEKRTSEPWSVFVYDRRGRGDSGDQGSNYSMETEYKDLLDVLNETGARHVLGHSLGGSVTLNTARTVPQWPVDRTSVYDPALNLEGRSPQQWIPAFADAVDAGNIPRAMARLRRGTDPTGPLGRVPEPILALIMFALAATPANRLIRKLLPTGVAELRAGLKVDAEPEDFSSLSGKLLFATGEHSADYFHTISEELARITGGTEHKVPRAVHGSIPSGNSSVVEAIAEFHAQD